MSDFDLILTRRREVEQEIARLKTRLGEMDVELAELDTAGRVMARLSGAKWPPVGEANERQSATVIVPAAHARLTTPDMIIAALANARARGLRGLEPKEIARYINDHLAPNVKGEYISSICWRMWKRGQLRKDPGSPLYSLPEKESAPDLLSSGEQSGADDQPSAQGGEARPGGGT
jgi:hypothetical protein